MTIQSIRSFSFCLLAAVAICNSCATAIAQSPPTPNTDKKLDSPFAAFRAGAAVSPVASIATGLDITFPRLRIADAWVTRVDVDLSAHFSSPSFGSRRDAEATFSVCQVYTPGGVNRGRYFVGAGFGPSIGPKSGIGGKLLAGINFSPVVSFEVEARFSPQSPVRAVLMVRLSVL